MSGYNLPDDFSMRAFDQYHGSDEAQCPTCKQENGDCDCCTSCGAGPNEACEADCECRSCQCADVNAHLGARESA